MLKEGKTMECRHPVNYLKAIDDFDRKQKRRPGKKSPSFEDTIFKPDGVDYQAAMKNFERARKKRAAGIHSNEKQRGVMPGEIPQTSYV